MDSAKILEIVAGGNLEEIKRLHSSSPFQRDLRDSEGNTPLHIAAAIGNQEVAQWILQEVPSAKERESRFVRRNKYRMDEDASWIRATNKAGYTSLDLAVKNSHLDLIGCLNLRGQFNLSKYLKEGIDNPNLLEHAIKHELYKLDFRLFENNLLNDAIAGCVPSVIEKLISIINENQVVVNDSCYRVWLDEAFDNSRVHYNPLYKTIKLGEVEVDEIEERYQRCKEMIIEWAKEKVRVDDIDYIIRKAIKKGRMDLISYFVESRGYELVFTGDITTDLLYLSVESRTSEITKYFQDIIDLSEVGVNPNSYLLCMKYAIDRSNSDIEAWCKDKIDGVDLHLIKESKVPSLLEIASKKGRNDIVEYLIETKGCKPHISDFSDFFIDSIARPDTHLLNYLKEKIDKGQITVEPERYIVWLAKAIKSYDAVTQIWCKEKIDATVSIDSLEVFAVRYAVEKLAALATQKESLEWREYIKKKFRLSSEDFIKIVLEGCRYDGSAPLENVKKIIEGEKIKFDPEYIGYFRKINGDFAEWVSNYQSEDISESNIVQSVLGGECESGEAAGGGDSILPS